MNDDLKTDIDNLYKLLHSFGWMNLGHRLCVCSEFKGNPDIEDPDTYTVLDGNHDFNCDLWWEAMLILKRLKSKKD